MLWHTKTYLVLLLVRNIVAESMSEAYFTDIEEFLKETRTNKDILDFEKHESALTDFESFPIVSTVEKNSSWCEVHFHS